MAYHLPPFLYNTMHSLLVSITRVLHRERGARRGVGDDITWYNTVVGILVTLLVAGVVEHSGVVLESCHSPSSAVHRTHSTFFPRYINCPNRKDQVGWLGIGCSSACEISNVTFGFLSQANHNIGAIKWQIRLSTNNLITTDFGVIK
jgi:hypothetical protein